MRQIEREKAISAPGVDALLQAEIPITAELPVSEALARLNKLVKARPRTSRIVELTPEMAKEILEKRNTANRPLKPQKIRDYQKSIQEGRWGLTGDTIKFASDGSLKDGQNRLAALVKAGQPNVLQTHAVFGVDPDLFSRMDIGKNRTPADVFAIAGLQYANYASATVRWLEILNSDNPGNRGATFSNEELLFAYARYDRERIEDAVRLALEVKKDTGAPVASTAALYYQFVTEDGRETPDAFFEAWRLGKPGPTRVLATKLAEMGALGAGRIHETVRNAMILKAYIAFRAKRKLSKHELAFDPADDAFPKL